ncbi:alkaline phosphatase [Streptomyces sp. TP-A0875]|uniref:alkaline phosphatase D family protein n=1 Tax=Streptomyces sp. TP-A0875 TaxID=552354 RepID=UPI00099CF180|nr:alkaline phosphatase D family protein [Streptomyces sp. TP-A0875]
MTPPRTSMAGPLRRRGFLGIAGAGAGALLLGSGPAPAAVAAPPARAPRDPFTLGVASGDPLPDAVVLWTRLAPDPLEPGGGMPARPVAVRWEVALDERFRTVVRRGVEHAVPEEAHTVHADVRGLEPHREYHYRFRVGDTLSPAGRTRTAPAPGTAPAVDFAFASCANWEAGHFTAYRHMAEERPDVVFHLGDYLYEYAAGANGDVRTHVGGEIHTLDDYRRRHAQYKTDPDLTLLHSVAPFIVTWDDHETDNNYAGLIPENRDPAQGNDTTEHFAARRRAAYQAYWEHMPLRRFRKPVDTGLPLYRRFVYGDTATFSVLDTRQYRTDQPYGDTWQVSGPDQWDPEATILGEEQHAWLEESLTRSRSTWNVLPQQIYFANWDAVAGPDDGGYNDGWDGYRISRDRVLGHVAERGIDNFVVLTGDVHANWTNDLRRDFERPETPVLGSEFVCTSITSGGDGTGSHDPGRVYWDENPHTKYYSDRRGYVRCTVSRDTYTADYRVVDRVTRPGAPVRTDRSFVIEAGVPGVQTP